MFGSFFSVEANSERALSEIVSHLATATSVEATDSFGFSPENKQVQSCGSPTTLKNVALKRLAKAALVSILSVVWVGAAAAQYVSGSSVSPTSYTGAGETLTFTVNIDSGSYTYTSLSISSALGVTYTCIPASSINTNTPATCTGTYQTTGANSGTLFESGTVTLTRNSTSGVITEDLNPSINLQITQNLPKSDQTITFTDPANITLASLNQAVSLSATASSGLTVSFSSATPAVCSVAGSTSTVLATGTCTVDANQAGNGSYNAAPQVSQSFSIGSIDTQPPVLTVPADIAQSTDSGLATAVVTYAAPTATDDSSGVTIARTAGPASGSVFSLGSTTVTHVATDAVGNTDTESFTVTVNDTEAPSVTPPADITVNVIAGTSGAVVSFVASASDNVPGVIFSSSPASGSTFSVGTTLVTVTATDTSANTAQATFNVTVVDNEAPVISGPVAGTAQTDPGQPTAVVAFPPITATDAVDGPITPTFTSSPTPGLAPGSAFPIGVTTLTIRAEDAAGNVATQDLVMTINDVEVPTISVPTDITVSTDAASATAVVNYTVTAADNSGPVAPVLTSGLASGSAFPVGTNAVNWMVTDPSGNTASGSFNVIVQDNEVPVVTVPADISVNTDPGQPTAVVTFVASVVDAVDGTITPVVTSAATAGLSSGSAFPIGTTTVTVAGADTAGNTANDSFTVTVTDNQVPVFTSTQADINVEIDFNLTSAVVTYPTPTASDNSGTATVTRTQGLASGSAFPVGTTLVEFTATDPTGLTSTLQFNVTVALIPPGTVTFVVNSPDDGTVVFNSATPAFNTSVVVAGGSGSSGGLQVVPGNYTATYVLPAGFAVTAASCSSASGSVSIATQTVTMSFARGETYVCTFTSRDIATQTGQQIQHFMDNRGRQIMSNQPSEQRRIARVNGDSNPNTVTMFGNRVNSGFSPLGIAVSQDRVDLSFASNSASEDPLSARSDWDIWFEASFSSYETSYGEGRFGIFHAGADYRIGENAILGFGIQIDGANEDVTGAVATTNGIGWMVGPYYTARIGESLYFDASLRYGRSDNEISPLGTYTDGFSTERWLASIGLFGSIDRDMLNIQPSVSINYFEETSEAYVDSLAVPIASRTTRLGDIEIGSRFTWNDPMGAYSTFVEFEGIYTFEANGQVAALSTVETGLRSRLGFGGTVAVGPSGMVDYEIRYDGLGDDDYEAVSVSFGFSMAF